MASATPPSPPTPPTTAAKTNPLLVIHLNLVVYSWCYWLVQPIIPGLIEKLGIDAVAYGNYQSACALSALVGSPIIGRVLDVYGANAGITICQTASMLLYFILVIAQSETVFMASIAPAMFQHIFLCSQSSVALLTSEETRAAHIGRLSLSYGIGMALGSPMGGFLATEYDPKYSAVLALTCSLAVIGFNVTFLRLPAPPPTVPAQSAVVSEVSSVVPMGTPPLMVKEEQRGFHVKSLSKHLEVFARVAFTSPHVRDVLISGLLIAIAMNCFRSMFALASSMEFGMDSKALGLFISFSAVVGLLTNVGLVSPALRLVGGDEARVLLVSMAAISLSFAGFVFYFRSYLDPGGKAELSVIFGLSVPMAVFSNLFYTVSSSFLTKRVGPGDQGTLVSLMHASRSFSQIISPALGGLIMRSHRFEGVTHFSGTLSLIAALFFLWMRRITGDGVAEEDELGEKDEPISSAAIKRRKT